MTYARALTPKDQMYSQLQFMDNYVVIRCKAP